MSHYPDFQKARIIRQLQRIPKEDFIRFGEFLYSPFFKARNKSQSFFDLLAEAYSNWQKLSSGELIRHLYPDVKPNQINSKWKEECNQLGKLFEEFVAHLQFEKNEKFRKRLFLEGLEDLGLIDFFSVHEKRIRSQFDDSQLNDYYLLESKLSLEGIKTDYVTKYGKRNEERNLIPLVRALDQYYFRMRIPILVTELQQRISFAFHEKELATEPFIEYCKRFPLKEFPIANIYFEILSCFQAYDAELNRNATFSKSNRHFQKAVDQLLNHFPKINEVDLNNQFTYLLSYGIKRRNAGDASMLKTLFSFIDAFHQVGKSKGRESVLFLGQSHARDLSKSIIRIALLNQQIEWAHKYIDQYFQYFSPETQGQLELFFTSMVKFEEGDFEGSLAAIRLFHGSKLDRYYDITEKELILKCYLSLPPGHTQLSVTHFLSSQKSFIEKLRTHAGKMEKERLEGNIAFARICKHLFLKKHEGKRIPSRVANEIQHLPRLREREWLQKVYEDLFD